MKYMILLYGSQRDYDAMSGKSVSGEPAWTPEDGAALHEFMGKWNGELMESGEFVDGRGLTAPVHARRVTFAKGSPPVVTDGPYAETQEVLAGYTIVECASYDRATEIAARLADTPHPESAADRVVHVDIRPVAEGFEDMEL